MEYVVVVINTSKRRWRSQSANNLPVIRFIFSTLSGIVVITFSVMVYYSYQDYIDPKHVYGQWLEVGTATYNRDTLELNTNGVFRNQRLVATQFKFDGENIFVATGSGVFIYRITGTHHSPQLNRVQPKSPTQRFVKQGFENTIDMEDSGIAERRRTALADHFNEN